MELEANKIKYAVAANKYISFAEQERLTDLEKRISSINKELGSAGVAQGATDKSNDRFKKAFNSASAGGFSRKEFESLNDLEIELEFEKNKTILNDKISKELLFSSERKSLEREYYELVLSYEEGKYKKRKENEGKIIDIIKQGAEIIGQISGQLIDYERSQQEARAESELETIDSVYEAKLKAAEGNAAETERLEKEYQTTKKAAEKKAAEERRQIALKEARINLALGIIKAIPNFLLMAVAAASGLIQIAAIQRQKFKKGGFTPKGNGQVDETGSVPVGIVHDNEYVAPKHQIRKYPGLFNFLDNDRKKFATGGFTGASVSGGFGVQISEQNMYMLAEIMSQRVSQGVYEASLKGTSHGSTEGSKQGIIKANREISSREASIKVNTF